MNVAVRDLQTLFDVGVMGGRSDGELLERFVERREGAVFEALVHRHGPMVWGVCRRVLRDHHDAEDAFQASFLILARKASAVLPRERLGNWLYGVAYQTARKARAMRAKRRVREIQVSGLPEPMAVPDDPRDHLLPLLDQELSRLPQKYRIPIVLCDLEGRTHKEAASQLGCPIGTVSSRLSRARAMLARRLSRRGVSLSAGSLAVLLAQEASAASMATRLIRSTARAASLVAARGAVTAGVVSARVAALTGEVLKNMLMSKLKIATTTLLVGSALAAGGTGLAYQARITEPGQKGELQRLIDEKKEELQRLIDKQKRLGQRTEGQEQRTGVRTPQGTPGANEYTIMTPQSTPGAQADRTTRISAGGYNEPGNIEDREVKIGIAKAGNEVGPSPEGGPLIDPPVEEADVYSPDQLRRQKEYIDAMLAVEEARSKTPEQLDEMIQAKAKDLERLRWAARVVEVQIRRLKKYRYAPRTDKSAEQNRGVFGR